VYWLNDTDDAVSTRYVAEAAETKTQYVAQLASGLVLMRVTGPTIAITAFEVFEISNVSLTADVSDVGLTV
jgi:hypothetical protein